MADSFFLKTLLAARSRAWGNAFFNPGKARQAAEALDATMGGSAGAGGSAPIGSILPWFGYNGLATVPSNWALCDGSVLNDADSPLNGQTLPALNSDTDPIFLGGYATVGNTPTLVASNLPSHTHGAGSYAVGAHTHGPGTLTTPLASTVAGAVAQAARDTTHTSVQLGVIGATASATPSFSGSSGTPSIGSGNLNLPHHMKVAFIIRVK